MYTPLLLRFHSSRWRAAADVGVAVSCRAADPHESTAQAASAVSMAPEPFLVIRARIGAAWSVRDPARKTIASSPQISPSRIHVVDDTMSRFEDVAALLITCDRHQLASLI
jgi:hypothetical protein